MIKRKLIFVILLGLVVIVLGCRFTEGYFLAPVALWVLVNAIRGRNGIALLGYLTFPIILFLNASVIGVGQAGLIARLSMLTLPLAFFVRGMTVRSCMPVPVWGLVTYLVCATISSAFGWFPMISYFKILNFGLFLFGVKLAVQNLNGDMKDIDLVRHGFIALAAFVILGSLLVYPFPQIGYSMEISNARLWGAFGSDADIGADIMERQSLSLFSGLLSHSQMLAPMTVMFVAWLLCDMLFVERRFTLEHGVIICAAPVLLYLTRSRTALVSLVFAVMMILVYALPKIRIGIRMKNKVRSVFLVMCCLAGVLLMVGEARSGMMSKWLFKTDDLGEVEYTTEQFISTRMGLVDANMHDFYLNPCIGKGFQTIQNHIYLYQVGKINILTAPVEKGVLPTMILGEGGLLGAAAFVVFLIGFYGFYSKRRMVCTITLFSTFLMTNMGEASFFSPGGPGGLYWLISIAGGMCVDYVVKQRAWMESMRWA